MHDIIEYSTKEISRRIIRAVTEIPSNEARKHTQKRRKKEKHHRNNLDNKSKKSKKYE